MSDLARLRNCIVEHAAAGEERLAERLLGALVTVETAADAADRDTVRFTAPRGTSELLERALQAMARSDRHDERARRTRHRAA